MLSPIARSTLRTSAVLILRLGIQAGTLLLIARLLGPDQFGHYAGLTAMAVLLGSFASFGTHLVLLAEVSKDPSQRHRVLAYAVPTTLLCGSALFAVFLLLVQNLFAVSSISLWVIACVGVTETLLLPLYTLPAIEELALENTVRSQLLMLLPLGLRTLAAAFILWLAPAGPMPKFMALYFASAIAALLAMYLYKPHAWPTPRQWRLPRLYQLKHSAGYATLALTSLGPSELDKILASKLLTFGVAGIYVAASRVVGAATLPVNALMFSIMPRLFRHSTQAPALGQRLNIAIFVVTLLYGTVLAVLLWLTAPWVQWLFGPEYADLAKMLRWLCWAVPGMALRIAAGSILMTLERPWRRAAFETLGVLSLVSTAIAFIPQFGAIGMAAALGISEWGMAIVGFIYIKINRNENFNHH